MPIKAPTGIEPVYEGSPIEPVRSSNPCKSWVYVIQREDGLVKIGVSTDPEKRILSIGYMIGDPDLYVWACVPGGKAEEKWLHHRWRHVHVTGEWFEPDDELLAQCDEGRLLDRPGGLCKFSRPAPSETTISLQSGAKREAVAARC